MKHKIQQNQHLYQYPQITNNTLEYLFFLQIYTLIHNISTLFYKNVTKLLEWVYQKLILGKNYQLIVLFSDKQLVCRIWELLGNKFTF